MSGDEGCPNGPEFSVSPLVLNFNRSSSEAKKIEIKSDEFENGFMIRTFHNLSDYFFTDIPTNLLTTNSSIHIALKNNINGKVPDDLFIKFRNHLDKTDENAITVKVEYVDKEDEEVSPLECQICYMKYTIEEEHEPILLNGCGHTFCNSCFKNLKGVRKTINCPFDRKRCIGTFSKNYIVSEIIQWDQRKQRKRKLKETERDTVETCPKPINACYECENYEATCHCITCRIDFCMNCFKNSHTAKSFSHHEMVRISEKPLIKPKCSYHPKDDSALICKTSGCSMYNETYCWQCAYSRHRHDEIHPILDEMDKSKKVLEKLLADVESSSKKFKAKFVFLANCMERLEKEGEFHDFFVNTIDGAQRMQDFMKVEKEKINKPQRENDKILVEFINVSKWINELLVQRGRLYDLDDVMKEGERLCQLDIDSYEHLMPPNPIPFPMDAQDSYPDRKHPEQESEDLYRHDFMLRRWLRDHF